MLHNDEEQPSVYIGILPSAGEPKTNCLAYYDDLTGLPNRTLFKEYVHKALEQDRVDLIVGSPRPVPLQKGYRAIPLPSADLVPVIAECSMFK